MTGSIGAVTGGARTCTDAEFPPYMRAFAYKLARLLLPGFATVALCTAARAHATDDCKSITDAAQRLACYDKVFGGPTETAKPAEATHPPVAGRTELSAAAKGLGIGDVMTTFWELTPAEKRGTFVVRTYLSTFFLPVLYTSSMNRQPESPTRGAAPAQPTYRNLETEFQISLRAKIAEGLLLPNADLWFAYTQQSFWQPWDHQDSAPFRDTDFQPEVIYVVPVPEPVGALPLGWHWRMAQIGFAHQSNGQSDPLSRSWNRLVVGTAAERDEFALRLRHEFRIRESASSDDNPDLTDYIGSTELAATWLHGVGAASLVWKVNIQDFGRGSLKFDWTLPFRRAKPEGLRWYLQVFSGYGETLLDYNHRQTSIGFGVMLFQL